ncbi:MAG: fumarylacetoacetate hydrolase [Magnetovibrio sp.]|nr:fumarylacetoacetate hydrolase [Magnetovibrio sp.]
MTTKNILPADGYAGTLVGRALFPGAHPGPCVVVIREDGVHNISGTVPTMAELLNCDNPIARANKATRNCVHLGSLDEILLNSTPDTHDPLKPYLLTPIDLHAVKGCGMTFVKTMLGRAIEEQAQGDPQKADAMHKVLEGDEGRKLSTVKPGSDEAEKLKAALIEQGMWSQYLEAGIGPNVGIFTKAQPLSTVGIGAEVGIHPDSIKSHSEPEVVLITNSRGRSIGATLGNDVNRQDLEGLSALYLDRAKNNNAACSIGPFIRLFDESFGIDDVRTQNVTLTVEGIDGYLLSEIYPMVEMTRSLDELVAQTFNDNHQYPDGLALFCGTMFFPDQDRDEPGKGFTHKIGDVVTIKAPALGTLINKVNHSNMVRPWNFGIADLMNNLADRHLIGG